MLKNKFKIIGLLFIILSLIIVPVVKAENEVNNDNIIISEDPQANDNQQTDITTEQNSESQNIQNSENNFKSRLIFSGGFFTALFTEITFILQPYHTVCKQLMIYVDFTVFSPEYDRYKIRLDI